MVHENHLATRGPGGVGLTGEMIVGLPGTRYVGGDEQDHVRILLVPRAGHHGFPRRGGAARGCATATQTGERTVLLPARVHDEKVAHGTDLPVGLVQRGA